jgi:diguanylate cyclase (GGDEF)-like protein
MKADGSIGGTVTARSRLIAKLRRILPQGGSLPAAEWRRRHAGMLMLLWVNVLVLPLYGLAVAGASARAALSGAIALGMFAALGATSRLSRKLRTVSVSLGLLTAAAVLIEVTNGRIESHFYFFVVIIVLTLYEEWLVFLMAVAYVLVHHGVIGTLEPHSVFNRPDEWANPWKWAAIHAAFVAAAGVAALATWRLNEDVRADMRTAQRRLEEMSLTDSLTGLGNRRKLMADLEETLASGQSAVFVLLDLDGFKTYNDTFGHPAGDSLLARLGVRLRESIGDRGRAYWLGGDEFCAIAPGAAPENRWVEARAAAALTERGEGFAVCATSGAVVLPDEADTAELALQAADRRMYQRKNGSWPSSRSQTKDVLLRAMAERHPDIALHVGAVMSLAQRVAERLGLPEDVVEQVRHAAALHDIGKVAIPDAILLKPGPLKPDELEFMRRHTLIGERIVSAAPALVSVAALVRSSHERYDGTGYPDGLRGDQIPICSRIVFVCDTFDAMTSHRPYRAARDAASAVAEIRRCSGSQFDPAVVAAFEDVLAEPLVATRSAGLGAAAGATLTASA